MMYTGKHRKPRDKGLYGALLFVNRWIRRDPIKQMSIGRWQAIALGTYYRLAPWWRVSEP
jgi:hypothetical protein